VATGTFSLYLIGSFYLTPTSHSHHRFVTDYASRNLKSLDHQLGSVHVTTHRLVYTDAVHPQSCSLGISLAHVTQTDFYAGFLKSSPKVTLFLTRSDPDAAEIHAQSWVCQVCSYRNPPGLGDTARACSLCGVVRDGASLSTGTQVAGPKSEELIYSGNIPSSLSSSASAIPHPTQSGVPDSIACPACTFLNHPSLRSCEICSTPLDPQVIAPTSRSFKSAPTSRPDTPTAILSERDSIKISFRRGGDKHFYAALKRTLIGKAWEVSIQKASSFMLGMVLSDLV
jgi:ESCRT-II complex subunit VPS36